MTSGARKLVLVVLGSLLGVGCGRVASLASRLGRARPVVRSASSGRAASRVARATVREGPAEGGILPLVEHSGKLAHLAGHALRERRDAPALEPSHPASDSLPPLDFSIRSGQEYPTRPRPWPSGPFRLYSPNAGSRVPVYSPGPGSPMPGLDDRGWGRTLPQ